MNKIPDQYHDDDNDDITMTEGQNMFNINEANSSQCPSAIRRIGPTPCHNNGPSATVDNGPSGGNTTWGCVVCTFNNGDRVNQCSICGASKPGTPTLPNDYRYRSRSTSTHSRRRHKSTNNSNNNGSSSRGRTHQRIMAHNSHNTSSSYVAHRERKGRSRERRNGIANILQHQSTSHHRSNTPLTARNLAEFDANNDSLANGSRSHSVPSKRRRCINAEPPIYPLPSHQAPSYEPLNAKRLSAFNQMNDMKAAMIEPNYAPITRTKSVYPSLDGDRNEEVKQNLYRLNAEASKYKSQNNHNRRKFQYAMNHKGLRRQREKKCYHSRNKKREEQLQKQRKKTVMDMVGNTIKQWTELNHGEKALAFLIQLWGLSPHTLFTAFPLQIHHEIMIQKRWSIQEMIWSYSIYGISQTKSGPFAGYLWLPTPDGMSNDEFKQKIYKLKGPYSAMYSRKANVWGPFKVNNKPGFVFKASKTSNKSKRENVDAFRQLFKSSIIVGNQCNYQAILNNNFDKELHKRIKLNAAFKRVEQRLKEEYKVQYPESLNYFKDKNLNEYELMGLRSIFVPILKLLNDYE